MTISEKQDIEIIIPQLESYLRSQDEYVRGLEMAVQLLQREVDNLRTATKHKERKSEYKRLNGLHAKASSIFNTCSTDKRLAQKLQDYLLANFQVVDGNLFCRDSGGALIPVKEDNELAHLSNTINQFDKPSNVNNGRKSDSIDLINRIKIIENKLEKGTYYLLLNLILREKSIGLFIGISDRPISDFSVDDLEHLEFLADSAALALDNIRSSQEITKMNKRLIMLNNQMLESSKLASIGEITSTIATEISTPLEVMRGHIRLMESGVGDKKRRIGIINEQIERIGDITSRLANLAGNEWLEKTPDYINLENLIDEVLIFSKYQLQRDGIRVEKEYEDGNYRVIGIKSQLEQVLLNILLNSRDTMLEGGHINIGLFVHDKNKLVINITDNGKGLEEKDLVNLFDPFYKSKNSKKGIGMGLYLSKRIIEQHGGSISVFSQDGKGSTFKIFLPLAI